MNELDFDELDKAVNSLMSGMSTNKRNAALDDPEETVVSLEVSSTASVSSSVSTPDSTPAASELHAEAPASLPEEPAAPIEASSRPAQPLAVKRRGQFMDMIHPSSAMKTATSAPKREGVTVQPSSPFVPPALNQFGDGEAGTEMKTEPTAPVLDVVTPAVTPAPEFPASQQSEEAAPKNDWPDPIDLANTSPAPSEEPTADSDVPADVVQEVAGPVADEPLASPFLPDAKVEKRPLGGPASDVSSEPEQAAPVADNADTQTAPTVQLPDELKTDIMSLESTSTNSSTPTVPESAPTDSTAVQAQSVAADGSAKEAVPTGSGSIPQQYTEQPSTSDQTNAPIYDTSTHQPLDVAAKKSSPMKWIIFFLVLLIIGAIAGAAYFYFTTHHL